MSEDKNAWVFDSLICFLHGPIWNAPLQTFIEEKSIVFDPNEKIDETNEEYQKIHDEYKHLVDFMLGSFMEELQITPEQFEIACLAGKQNSNLSFHQGLFQQIWAANDIRIFVRMMTQKNVELQLQVLDVIERRHMNSTANSKDDESLDALSPNNDIINADSEIEDIITKQEFKKIVSEQKKSEETNENAQAVDPEVDEAQEESTIEEQENNVADKLQRLNLYFEKENRVDSAEIKSRQEYLKAQRDKILAIKKRVRTDQLQETVKRGSRPKSARAAHQLLRGEGDWGSGESMDASLQLRKTLAKRLRNEVVGSNN